MERASSFNPAISRYFLLSHCSPHLQRASPILGRSADVGELQALRGKIARRSYGEKLLSDSLRHSRIRVLPAGRQHRAPINDVWSEWRFLDCFLRFFEISSPRKHIYEDRVMLRFRCSQALRMPTNVMELGTISSDCELTINSKISTAFDDSPLCTRPQMIAFQEKMSLRGRGVALYRGRSGRSRSQR